MVRSLSSSNRTVFDVLNIIAGLGLLLSPWYLGFTNETYAAWNAWIVGAAVAVIAAAALFAFHEAEEWVTLVVGLWAVIAPWALGFSAATDAMWAHVVAGIVVAVMAGASIWFVRGRQLSTA
ncbi:MAG: SPW repeat protein [Pseudomonadota bacterium]